MSYQGSYIDNEDDDDDYHLCPRKFYLDTCFLSNLCALDLLSLSYDTTEFDLQCSPHCLLDSKCVPNLTRLMMGINVVHKSWCIREAERTVEFACDLASWSGLQVLQLELQRELMYPTRYLPSDVTVLLNGNSNVVSGARGDRIKVCEA